MMVINKIEYFLIFKRGKMLSLWEEFSRTRSPSSKNLLLEEYKRDYKQLYGDISKTPEHAKRRQQKYIYECKEKIRQKLIKNLNNNRVYKFAKKMIAVYLPKPDIGLKEGPVSITDTSGPTKIRLTVGGKNVCYDVVELYYFLAEDCFLCDPTTGVRYSKDQLDRIRRSFDRCCPGKPSAILYEQNLRYN